MTYQPGIYRAQGGNELHFKDDALAYFGTSNDVSLEWDGTNLVMLPVADDTGAFHIGNGTLDFDVKVFLSASTKFVLFDVGNALLTLDDVDLKLGDNDILQFGDAAGGDVSIRWNATNLSIVPAVDDTGAILIGDGTTDMDLKVFLGAVGSYVLFDVGNTKLVSTVPVEVGANGAGIDTKLFGGTASCYAEYDASEDRLNVIQTNAATTGVETSLSVQQTHTGVGASAEAFESILTSNVALGTYANAIFGKVDLSTSGEVTGLIGVICAEVTMPSTDAPSGGEYAAFEAEFNMAGSSVNGRPLPVLDINVWGGNESEFDSNGLLFDIAGVTTGDGKFFRTNAVAFNNCDAFLKCRVGGTVYYIPLSDNQAGT